MLEKRHEKILPKKQNQNTQANSFVPIKERRLATPHHYRKDVTEAMYHCNKCGRQTLHRVYDGRLAHCLEHEAQQFTKAQLKRKEQQEKEKREPKLF